MYRKWIGPHTCLNHLLSASGWDWAVLTSLCDIPVILMVTSPICLSFPNFLGDGRVSTVISFCHFPSLMQFVLIRLANISTALQTCLSNHCRHFPQWKNPHLNQALFKQRSNFACGAQLCLSVVLREFGYITIIHKDLTWLPEHVLCQCLNCLKMWGNKKPLFLPGLHNYTPCSLKITYMLLAYEKQIPKICNSALFCLVV